jgi:uncharacterized protein
MTAPLDDAQRRSADRVGRLLDALRETGGALVAFSGGVDSAFLLAAARRALAERAVALTAHSPAVPASERAAARALAAGLGCRHLEVESREGEVPAYVANGPDRCFHCKVELYRLCREAAAREGLAAVVDGFNADDRLDHRPGHRAAVSAGVRSPLAEAALGKEEIRAWSRAWGLPTWDKPQLACLASRIPHGTPVTPERLQQVERAEAALGALGLRVVRVRHHGQVARLELGADDQAVAFAHRAEVVAAVKAAGFAAVALDLEPFRSGRLNELSGLVLPVVG